MMLVYKNQVMQVVTNLGKLLLAENNTNKAIQCFEIAAEKGSSDSLLELAMIYYKGSGVKCDLQKAKYYFKILSNKYNSDIAQYNLGMIYNTEEKYLKSKQNFDLSAMQNNTDALMKLGIIYRDGLGVKKDPYKTFEYFEMASKLNNPNAFFYLAVFYQDGFGVEKNISRSIKFYKLACRFGVQESLTNLGTYYENEGNVEMAKYYWSLSSNPKSQYNLGILYLKEEKYIEAKALFEKAAKQGHSDSILSLGKLYLHGHGVEKNIKTAFDYIVKAARLNNQNAINIINEAYDELIA